MNFNPKTFKTLEFLLVVLANVAAWLLAVVDYMPTRYAVYATALAGAMYALSRGLAKVNTDVKDYWQTTEFWVAAASSVPAIIAAFADTIGPTTYGIIQTIIVMVTGIMNGARKDPAVATGAVPVVAVTGMNDPDIPDEDWGEGDNSNLADAEDPLTPEGPNLNPEPQGDPPADDDIGP